MTYATKHSLDLSFFMPSSNVTATCLYENILRGFFFVCEYNTFEILWGLAIRAVRKSAHKDGGVCKSLQRVAWNYLLLVMLVCTTTFRNVGVIPAGF